MTYTCNDLGIDLETFIEMVFYDTKDLNLEVVSDEEYDQSRWLSKRHLIIKKDGRFYRCNYTKGLTELQEARPWEDDDDPEFIEVAPVEKTIIIYKEVEDT